MTKSEPAGDASKKGGALGASDPDLLAPLLEIVDQAYEAISFEAGEQPDWTTFRSLFTERAVLALRVFPTDKHSSVMNLDEYERAQLREDLAVGGYEEVPISRSGRIIRDLGIVDVRFDMRFPNGDVVSALDVYHLVRTAAGWRIASISSDMLEGGDAGNSAAPLEATDDAP